MHKTFLLIFIAVFVLGVPGAFAEDTAATNDSVSTMGITGTAVPPVNTAKPMPVSGIDSAGVRTISVPVSGSTVSGGAIPTIQGVLPTVKSATQNEFLELRKVFREEADNLKNEYLDAKKTTQQNSVEIRKDIKSAGQEEAARIREELKNNVGEIKAGTQEQIKEIKDRAMEAKEQGIEAFQKAREAAMEQAKQIQEESKTKVETLRVEALDAVQQHREEFMKKIETERQEFMKRLEEQKNEFEKKLQERKAQFETELQKVKDEKKKEILLRVDENINELNKRVLGTLSETLKKLESVLANIATRADKAEAGGRDVSAVRTAIVTAKDTIGAARTAIEFQSAKSYSFTINTEETLKSDVGAARDALKKDLQIVKAAVETAREGVQTAATTLAKIPNVNGYEFATSSVPVSQNTQSEQNQ